LKIPRGQSEAKIRRKTDIKQKFKNWMYNMYELKNISIIIFNLQTGS